MDKIDWESFGIERSILKEGMEQIKADWPRFLLFFITCALILTQIQSELYTRANLAEAYSPLIKAGQACRDQIYQPILPSCDIRIGDIVLVDYKNSTSFWLSKTPPT